jgi:predicted permease
MQGNYGAGAVPRSARVAPLQADAVGGAGRTLWVLFGAVALLLVIACVNVASLFMARGAARQAELAVRSALGCSRWRLVRQLVVESLLLSLAGGVAGLGVAHLVTRVLLGAAPEAIARTGAGVLDASVFLFGFVVAAVAGLAFGTAPAVQFTRPDLERVLREGGRGGTASRRQTRARNALVICQVALALVLLVGAGLLLRSFERLRAADLGIDAAHVLTFDVHLPAGRYEDPARRVGFHRDLQQRVGRLPGVRAAAAVSRLPVTGTYHSWGTRRPDRPPRAGSGIQPEQRVIEGDYFAALRIPVLRGRTFSPLDTASAPRRVVISAETMRRVFPDEDPVGRRLNVAGSDVEVIGVVGDVAIGARAARRPMVYHSHTQFADNRNWALTQVVALDRDTPGILSEVRRELAAIDPALVLDQPRMLEDVIGRDVAQERFAMLLLGAFALLALVLAAVGIYGVLSYAVTARGRELGIRMALGASTGSVRRLVVGDGGRLALAGLALGLPAGLAATRALGSLLYGVSATEPMVFAAAAGVLGAAALAASWIPARTATKVDPLQALRS